MNKMNKKNNKDNKPRSVLIVDQTQLDDEDDDLNRQIHDHAQQQPFNDLITPVARESADNDAAENGVPPPLSKRNGSSSSIVEKFYSYFTQRQNVARQQRNNEILFSVWIFILRFIFALIAPIGLMVIGALFMDKCPVDAFLPVWLILYSAVLVLILVMCIIFKGTTLRSQAHGAWSTYCYYVFLVLFGVFEFIWLIIGMLSMANVMNVVTYDRDSVQYCSPLFFYLLFWKMTVMAFVILITVLDFFINIALRHFLQLFLK